MDGMIGKLVIESEKRPALVKTNPIQETRRKALVHEGIIANQGQLWCEFEDGKMREVRVDWVQYLDSAELFDSICWERA